MYNQGKKIILQDRNTLKCIKKNRRDVHYSYVFYINMLKS